MGISLEYFEYNKEVPIMACLDVKEPRVAINGKSANQYNIPKAPSFFSYSSKCLFHEVQNNDKVDFSRKISSLDETEYDYRYPLSNHDTT